jgi:hypothetical protein
MSKIERKSVLIVVDATNVAINTFNDNIFIHFQQMK